MTTTLTAAQTAALRRLSGPYSTETHRGTGALPAALHTLAVTGLANVFHDHTRPGEPWTACITPAGRDALAASPAETVVSNVHGDAWRCPCGNDVIGHGFHPSTPTGVTVEPSDTEWDGAHVACLNPACGRIADQTTIRPADPTQPSPTIPADWTTEERAEFASHVVTIVRGPGPVDTTAAA